MSDLSAQHCKPCEGGVRPIGREEANKLLNDLTQWQLNDDATEIRRDVSFKNFYKTMAFVNAVAWIANQEGHHPDLEVGYNYCNIKLTTHAIDGLSKNDFICAAKIDELL